MDANLIFTVALAAAIIVVVLALVGIIIYYSDKNATLGRFIDENAELRRKIRRTGVVVALLCLNEHRDSINEQSIMFRHTGNKATSHFQLNSRPRIQTTGDPMIGVRDRIVRKRRINEGHPLPPPTPVMRK